MLTPFLRQVARYFQSKGDFHNYCFVLPNHRSCTFLEREFDLASNGVYITPAVTTITDFVTSLSGLAAVPAVEALFKLYKCYTSLSGNEAYPFDKLVYWGNVLLKDFNDVDMYLVDPEQIFNNVRELREIQSNYIDSDVREIVRRYLNMSVEGMAGDDDDFWRDNYSTPSSQGEQVKKEFMRLWNSMLELYTAYHHDLAKSGMSSMGNIYRTASLAVKDGKDLGHKKYVFVGFNVLSTSEIAIFKRLQNRGKALFFWDASSPAFSTTAANVNPGGRYVNFFLKEFPQPADFIVESIDKFPSIKVYGVPSDVGQVQCASRLLDDFAQRGELSEKNAINTALVMPDESLFVPLLNSLNIDVNVNVTMGYPLQSSDIASLMRIVAKLHRQARREASGEWSYYRGMVKTVLSHPLIKTCFGHDAIEVMMKIDEGNLFVVPQSLLQDKPFGVLFRTIDRVDDVESVKAFLNNLIEFCTLVKEQLSEDGDEQDDDQEEKPEALQLAFINQYCEVLTTLVDMLSRYDLPPCESTVFFLIDRLSAVISIPFEGEPLQGLQIMGMLETRCLDFEKVIILSCDERVLPRKFRSNSFISDYMRRYYGMSTVGDQESMWAYYFYRLISRASEVHLFHDTSTKSTDSKEITRYVPQLEMIYGCQIEYCEYTLNASVINNIAINVPKTGHVLDVLESYKMKGGKRHSASSINEYINCPLSFYFHYIERLSTDNAEDDFMGAGTFGTIVHDSLQQLYFPDVDGMPREGEHKVTCGDIKRFIKTRLDTVVRHEVNRTYLRAADLDQPLHGEASIISVAILNSVRDVLRYDIDLLNNIDDNFLTVLECEKKHKGIMLNYGGVDFNFTYTADRIDRLSDGTVRMVDYKTGSDKTDFNDMEDLFNPNKDKRCKAVLQLMLYCNAYAQEMHYDEAIKPVIYKLRDIDQSGVFYGSGRNKVMVHDYRAHNTQFNERMDEVMRNFFDKDTAFTQTTNTKPSSTPCRYCKFADFCRR